MNNEELNKDFEYYYNEGMINNVLGVISTGKEAIVYLAKLKKKYFAIKLFKDRKNRSFSKRNDYSVSMIGYHRREARALRKKTNFGQMLEESLWQSREVDIMNRLYQAGADVPQIHGAGDNSFIMDYVGDKQGHGKRLVEVKRNLKNPYQIYRRIIENMELFIENGIVHGDLSPYNILYSEEKITIIDFPQAIQIEHENRSFELLERDFQNIVTFFRRIGVVYSFDDDWYHLAAKTGVARSNVHWTSSKNKWSRGKI